MIKLESIKVTDSQTLFNNLSFGGSIEKTPRSPQSTAAHLLLRVMLERSFGYSEQPRFIYGKRGKPYLVSPDGESMMLWFNLSHSGDYAVCAVSDEGEIGVDIQKIVPARMKAAKRVFTAGHYAALEAVQGGERDTLFCELWVLREAAIKARGGSVLEEAPYGGAKLIDAPQGYRIAIATKG